MAGIHRHLTCGKCHRLYTEPRRLPDGHTFCTGCLRDLDRTDDMVICPQCHQPQQLPDNGVDGLILEINLMKIVDEFKCGLCLKNDMLVQECENCTEYLCPPCHDVHQTQNKCPVLRVLKQLERYAPTDQLNTEIDQKRKIWQSIIPQINQARMDLKSESIHHINRIEHLTGEIQENLDTLEEKARRREAELAVAVVVQEFTESVKADVRSLTAEADVQRMTDDVTTMQDTLVNIQERLNEDTDQALRESEALTKVIRRLNEQLETEYDDALDDIGSEYVNIKFGD